MNRFISAVFLATVSFLISCNDDDKEPDYPIEPYIESADLKFVEIEGLTSPDSLILSFYFRDGDMDLGLDYQTETDLDSPYHSINLYLQKEKELIKITTNNEKLTPENDLYPSNIPSLNTNNHDGKLAVVRTKKLPGFEYLPDFSTSNYCNNYTYTYLLVDEKDKSVFDESYKVVQTFQSVRNSTQYLLVDTFYYDMNPNFYNIKLDFLVKQPDDSFLEFDWNKEYCTTFNGRFPLLKGIKKGTTMVGGPFKIKGHSTKDGELRYSMKSMGFKALFSGKTIKLRIKIKDRALHDSNIIETNEIAIP